MKKMASNLTGGDLVWAVENSGQTFVWKLGRDLYLYFAYTKEINGKTVICSGVALSCKKRKSLKDCKKTWEQIQELQNLAWTKASSTSYK